MRQSLLLFLRANRRHLAELLLASGLVNVFALALPLFSMLVYDKAIGNEVHDTLWALAIGMGLLLAQELVLRTARVYMIEHAGARWDAFLDERLMRGVLAAPLSKPIGVADLVNKVRELGATRDVLSAQGLMPLADLPFLALFIAAVALIGGPLVFVPLGVGAVVIAAGAVLQGASIERQRTAHAATRDKMTTLVDVLAARESLHGRPLAHTAESRWRQQSQAGARAAARARWWSQVNQQLVPVLMSVSSVLVLVIGVLRVEAQDMSVGGLISVNMLGSRLLVVMCGAAPLVGRWREFIRALAGLGETVALDAPPTAAVTTAEGALSAEGVRLEGLAFGYPAQPKPVLDGISVHLRAGELVALVGASGSGKSTLMRLLAGQLPHTQGRLTFGARQVVDDAGRQWLGRQVQHKPQDPCFLGGSVREVVAAGDTTSDDTRILEALRSAGLGALLDASDLALNTPIATNGANLSGGQRQMLALATAFHGRQPMLLLDEPTLGLDRTAQERVIDALPALKAGRCVLVATHAVEVIRLADRVLVLDRGRIVADAPPGRLFPATAAAPSGPAIAPPAVQRPTAGIRPAEQPA